MADMSRAATPRVEAGGRHALVLLSDGAIWAWGDNAFGQLGDRTQDLRTTPVRIDSDTTWASLAAGFYHTLALKSDGSLWAWGDNTKGQLGDGAASFNQPVPVRIGTDTDWAAVAAGDFHSLALKSDGSLWAWGENSSGQIGDGLVVPANQTVPVRIGTDTDWIAIAAGGEHSAALKADRTLWVWGGNGSGQLGNGTTIDAVAPVRAVLPGPLAPGDSSVLAAGKGHTQVVLADSTLWSWGNNTSGQLGTGTQLNNDLPAREGGLATGWKGTAAGDAHGLAWKADGTLWAWGGNASGQLGSGSFDDAVLPVRVGSASDWIAASSGEGHSVALKADASIWTWGDNSFGQVGDGTSVARNIPQQVLPVRFSTLGDLDQNGRTDVADALRALKIAVGMIQPTATDMQFGDVAPLGSTGVPAPDRVIDVADALEILRKAVGIAVF